MMQVREIFEKKKCLFLKREVMCLEKAYFREIENHFHFLFILNSLMVET